MKVAATGGYTSNLHTNTPSRCMQCLIVLFIKPSYLLY